MFYGINNSTHFGKDTTTEFIVQGGKFMMKRKITLPLISIQFKSLFFVTSYINFRH